MDQLSKRDQGSWFFFHYLPGEVIDDLSALKQNEQSMMAIQNRPVYSSLQRAWLPRMKREFDRLSWQSADCFEFHLVQSVCGMEELQFRSWRVHLV
jgi:hypothetical protein